MFEAIRLDPRQPDAFYNRGIAYKAKGELDRAIADYVEAIRLAPRYANAFNNRGNIYKAKGQFDRAIADFDQAIRINPNYAVAYFNRGLTWERKNDLQRALADYQKSPRSPRPTRMRGPASSASPRRCMGAERPVTAAAAGGPGTRFRRKSRAHFHQVIRFARRQMPWLRYHYHCEACDGTWLVEAEAGLHADCRFCGARDVLPYRSDRGRIGRARLEAVAGGKRGDKTTPRPGKLKRSA